MRVPLSCMRALPMLPLLVLALGACGDSTPTANTSRQSCGSASVVALAALQAATLDCSTGSVIQLTGGGAHYLIVPEFATSNVSNAATSYVLTDSDALATSTSQLAASRTPFLNPGASASRVTSLTPGARQLQFDAALRATARKALAKGQWFRPGASGGNTSARASVATPSATLPAQGSIRTFQVINTFDPAHQTFATVNAKLLFVGANTLVYVDTLAPANGFTASQLNAFGQQIDQTFFTIDVNAFGPPSDIDGNGRVIVLLSPIVNALSPAAKCAADGYIAGFFFGLDLSSTTANSNKGEIYYGLVPDPGGTVSCAHSVATVASIAPGTFLHELQHMISFSQHAVVHGGAAEEGWLDEGMSIVAQELGSEYYEHKFPPPAGRTNPNQLLPDSAEGFIADQFVESFDWLQKPDTTTLTLHSDADGGLLWRAGDWLFVHWLGDQKGSGFYKRLEESSSTGTDNIAAAAGEPFQSLFGDFGLALYTDSIPGIPKSSIPQRDKFTTRNLRAIYQAVSSSGGAGGAGSFPITVRTLSGQATGSMVPGTVTYYEIFTSPSVATTTLRFSPSSGGTFQSSLHPQVSVFRLQ
jgi:hypothetical protein